MPFGSISASGYRFLYRISRSWNSIVTVIFIQDFVLIPTNVFKPPKHQVDMCAGTLLIHSTSLWDKSQPFKNNDSLMIV